METPLAIVERVYRAWAERDYAEALSLVDPDVRWHQDDGLPYGGVYTGREAVAGVLRDALSDWRRLDVTPHRFMSERNVVVVFGAYEGEGLTTGFLFEDRFTHLWQIENGRGVAVGLYRTPAGAMRELDRHPELVA